jgi:hypothetical protein
MAKAVVVEWNGSDIPDELRELPAGRYVLASVDESVPLTDEEEEGLVAALKSSKNRVLAHDDVMNRAREILAG